MSARSTATLVLVKALRFSADNPAPPLLSAVYSYFSSGDTGNVAYTHRWSVSPGPHGFVLGLGASGPQVVEGFHGVPYDKPMVRTKEYIDICRMTWRREPLVYDGQAVKVPLPAGEWTLTSRGYRFRSTSSTYPIQRVTVTADSIRLRGGKALWEYTLDEQAQGRVAVRLQLGAGTTWCAARAARASSSGHSGRSSPGQVPARSRNEAAASASAAARRSMSVARRMARSFTPALARASSRHRRSSMAVSATEKPSRRARCTNRSVRTSSSA